MSESDISSQSKKRKRKRPATHKAKTALMLAGAAVGGAAVNNIANRIVDKSANVIADRTSRAIENRREKQGGNGWETAAKKVK